MESARLTFRIIVLPACLILLCAIVFVAAAWNDPVEILRGRLEAGAAALQNAAGDPNSELLAEIAEAGGYQRAWIVDGVGMIISSSQALEVGTQLEAEWANRLVASGGATRFEAIEWGDRTMFLAARRSALTGRWSVVLDEAGAVWRRRAAVILSAIGGTILSIVLLGAGVHRTLDRKILRPLAGVDEAAKAVLEGVPMGRESLDRLTVGTPVSNVAEALWRISSEREDAAVSLKESRALYFSALHLTEEMIWITRFDGTMVEVNRSFCERLGVARKAVVGKPMKAFRHMLPEKPLLRLGEMSAREQKVFDRMLFTFTTAKGEALNVVASVQAVPHDGRAAFMVAAYVQARTARKSQAVPDVDDEQKETDLDEVKGDVEPSDHGD